MSSSNCCFLTCIWVSQEADQVVWYSHLFQNFPQLIVIHTVKGFGMDNKAEIDVFLERSSFFHDLADVGNLISGFSAFSKTSLNIWKFTVHILLKPGLQKELPLAQSQGQRLRVPGCVCTRPRGVTPRPRCGVAAEKSYHMPEVRGGGQEEQPHVQGAAAAWAKEDREKLLQVQGQEGWP